jgi:predicted PurR-regulated permease PerM
VTRRFRVDLTWRTLARVLLAGVLVWVWLRLWQWVLLLIVAAFIAIGLDPLVTWLDRRHVRRRYASPLVVLVLAALLFGFVYFAGAELIQQGKLLSGRIGDVQKELTGRLPPFLLNMLPSGEGGTPQISEYLARFGRALVSGLFSIGVALILTIYFLLDGRRTYEWLVAFAPRDERPRVRQTAVQARQAIIAYVRGNVLTSIIAAVCAYVFCIAFKVPAPLLLALLTGLFDFVPVIGVFLTAIPMVLLALTVSVWVGVATAVFNALYNIVETYYISPKVYGDQLRLSSLAVILGFAIGAELGGVVGALIALPIIAMYPAIEQIWLADRLAPEVTADHRRIEETEEH